MNAKLRIHNSAAQSLNKLVVFGDPAKGKVSEAIAEFLDFVRGKVEVIADRHIDECSTEILDQCDYAVVFGGDGSIISAARHLSRSNVPVIGVNLGKLGFLAEFSVEELKKYFNDIISGNVRIEKRMMLGCCVQTNGDERFRSNAVNDVFVMAGPPFRTIELRILVDGQPLAGCVSDGLIISTPTGSTAYNLSAGGPILAGNMEAMVITPICPHSLSFRPIVISAESRVEVIGLKLNEGSAVLVDGQVSIPVTVNDVISVSRQDYSFLIANNPLRTQWDTLATKLSWAEKPRYSVT